MNFKMTQKNKFFFMYCLPSANMNYRFDAVFNPDNSAVDTLSK